MEKTYIIVKTRFEGVHKWGDAPKEVSFLRFPHRHIFHVSLKIPVAHPDRELEFFMVKRELDKRIDEVLGPSSGGSGVYEMVSISCETVASALGRWVKERYEIEGAIVVQVFEDGENGAEVEIS